MRRALLLACVLALAGGCALPGPAPSSPRPAREAVTAFRIEGRIAVRRAEERFAATIVWRHEADSDEIVLSGPLGQGLARLSAAGGTALLETADGRRYAAADLDALAEQVFGAALPVSGLGRWVLGRTACDGLTRLDGAGRPSVLAERGWTIEYRRYDNETAQALPTLLLARQGEIELRLVIDRWTVAP